MLCGFPLLLTNNRARRPLKSSLALQETAGQMCEQYFVLVLEFTTSPGNAVTRVKLAFPGSVRTPVSTLRASSSPGCHLVTLCLPRTTVRKV